MQGDSLYELDEATSGHVVLCPLALFDPGVGVDVRPGVDGEGKRVAVPGITEIFWWRTELGAGHWRDLVAVVHWQLRRALEHIMT